MSSYFDDASLVMIPSGYKTSKVYSVKPTDGSGDLTFSRSNDTASRIAPNGLIEKVRTNVALYSEDLTNAAWTKNRSTITANALANPVNGATTADYIVENTANGTHEAIQTFIVTSGVSYTVSVYAKADTRTKIALVLAGSAFASGGNGQAIFNLSTGAVISAINGATARISSAGNGWYRCSITKASIDTAGVIALELVDASDNTSYTGDGTSRAAFFGAQLEVSDFGATDYIATTSAAVSVGPVANVPRLDYLNSSCPRLLLEPQRTNSVTYSEQLNNAAWNNVAAVTANTIASPDGSLNADTVTGIIYQFFSSTAATTFTFSVFAKKNSGSTLTLRADATSIQTCSFNLDTLVTGVGGTITNYGNGWYRCAFTFTANATATSVAYILPPTSVYLYGCQLEQGAYATSYIPTLGSASTRGADAASKTSASALIGQTEGTIVLNVENNESEVNSFITLSPSATTVSSHVYLGQSAGNLALYVRSGGTYSIIAGSITSISGIKKVALAYGPSFARIYVNGAQVYNSTAAVIPSGMDKIEINSFNTSSDIGRISIGEALIFKTILPDADLAALTA